MWRIGGMAIEKGNDNFPEKKIVPLLRYLPQNHTKTSLEPTLGFRLEKPATISRQSNSIFGYR
jgi:hypothetical protein